MLGTNVGQKAAQRVNIGCNEDKIWVFKPNPSQILSKDIIKTKVRHLLDIFWYWTKPGQKLGDLHCTPAPNSAEIGLSKSMWFGQICSCPLEHEQISPNHGREIS